jgi:hypothetical protein
MKNPRGEVANFSRLFGQAWSKVMSVKNVTAGFKVNVIYPLDRTAIQLPGEEDEEVTPQHPSVIEICAVFHSQSGTRDTPSRNKRCQPAELSAYASFSNNSN